MRPTGGGFFSIALGVALAHLFIENASETHFSAPGAYFTFQTADAREAQLPVHCVLLVESIMLYCVFMYVYATPRAHTRYS